MAGTKSETRTARSHIQSRINFVCWGCGYWKSCFAIKNLGDTTHSKVDHTSLLGWTLTVPQPKS